MLDYLVKKRKKILDLLLTDPGKFFKGVYKLIKPMRADYRKKFNLKIKDWYRNDRDNIIFTQCKWMGVRAMKNPLDAWIYQEIIYEVKPEVIIEIGSADGGSTLFFADLLELIGKGKVISIDIDREKYKAKHQRIITFTGDSSSEKIVSKVKKHCKGKSVMIIHDGDHTKKQVLKDLEQYWNLVSVGSYLIVEDGIIDLFKPGDMIGHYEDGPLLAIEEFMETNDHFEIDESRERYIITYSPRGFLKRIR